MGTTRQQQIEDHIVQSRRAGMNLPEDTYLAYTVWHETELWQMQCRHDRINKGRRSIGITPAAIGGGAPWEFGIVEYDFRYDGSRALHLEMFGDSWSAFKCMAPLFDALASGDVKTLEDVRALLDRLGAIDRTDRP